jgi:hypothetical protein
MTGISQQLLEQLLFEEEGTTLDFKRDQYPFDHANEIQKSELLKDIIAFANSWRRSDAYILIGVEEVKGSKSIVKGVLHHLDDAHIQQFINTKTQKPIHFSYHATTFEGKDIGVIHIPIQERPIYLKANYGSLKKDAVYIRRGSSTDIASPDEIAKMGRADIESIAVTPILEVELFDNEGFRSLGSKIERETINLTIPKEDEIPDYGTMKFPVGLGIYQDIAGFGKNRNFYREMASYLRVIGETVKLDFKVTNAGTISATDIRVEAIIQDPNSILILYGPSEIPKPPSTSSSLFNSAAINLNDDIQIRRSDQQWVITGHIKKVQPKAYELTHSGFRIGAKQEIRIGIEARIYADNLPEPKNANLNISIKPDQDTISVESLIEFIEKQEMDK